MDEIENIMTELSQFAMSEKYIKHAYRRKQIGFRNLESKPKKDMQDMQDNSQNEQADLRGSDGGLLKGVQ